LIGIEGLIDRLKTNGEAGLTPIDFNERAEHFGSNYKPPHKRTPFCRLFLGALEDFMLRLLLVCACISITIDMIFADPHERSHGKLQ
jgi:magnesium-transporting ATPase (P-type)